MTLVHATTPDSVGAGIRNLEQKADGNSPSAFCILQRSGESDQHNKNVTAITQTIMLVEQDTTISTPKAIMQELQTVYHAEF